MIISKTPLRITLAGGGTDLPSYYIKDSGYVISLAIDKYIYISLNKTFVDYVLSESIESTNLLRNEEIEQITLLNNERDKSKEQLQKLESQKTIDLEEYVKQYNLQIVE